MRDPEKKAKIAAAVLLAAAWLAACGDATLTSPRGDETRVDGGSTDPSSQTDGDSGASLKPSGCPTPETVKPGDLPAGFLAPQTVKLVRDVDGDTAHFNFPTAGELVIRFLWVNTEESHDNATQFGIETAGVVKGYLENAKEIVVALQEDKKKPGSAALDPYGRSLGLVFVDGDLFQTRLVREGWSAYYTVFGCAPEPVHDALLWSEAEARANARGIWEAGHPTDYAVVLKDWIGTNTCRPNPYKAPYCK